MQPLLCDLLPVFDGPYFVALASRFLHIVSAALLVGGLFYLRLVVAPQVETSGTMAEDVYGSRRKAWALVVMVATLLLLVTGLYNLFVVIIWPNDKLPPLYHMLFGLKFLLSLPLFFVAAALAGRSSLGTRFRGGLKLWLNVALVVALVIVALASTMRSIPKIPKPADNLIATIAVDSETN